MTAPNLLAQPIRAVAFDVYGTLCHIKRPRAPYKALLRRSLSEEAVDWRRKVMCQALPLDQFAQRLGLTLTRDELADLGKDLREEIASIECFTEVP